MDSNTIKVLICDDTAKHGIKMASSLREMGVYAYTRKNNGETIFNAILSEMPDVVVTDLTLEDSDSIMLIEKLSTVLSQLPAFIVTSDINNSFIKRQVLEGGASYFLPMPFDAVELVEIIKLVACKKTDSNCSDAELIVTEMIQKIGVPAHIKGYRYIRTAILECLENRSKLDSFTKDLYPTVAGIYDTTPSRVERAIRHAIDAAWNRGSKENLSLLLGYTVGEKNSRPTNSEFIALAADKLLLRMRYSDTNLYSA